MKKIWFATLAISSIMAMSSCRKDFSENVQSAEDNAQIETEYSQIYDMVADYAASSGRIGKTESSILPSGAEVVFTDSLYDDGDGVDFYINFGPLNNGGSTKGIQCKDGRYRAGIVHVGLTNHWSEVPDTVTIAITAADNYYAGNGSSMYKITGTKVAAHTAQNEYHVVVSDATLQRENGTASWSAERFITITNNVNVGWLNNEYDVTGTAEGTSVAGEAFTVETLTPLHKKVSYGCLSTYVSGELELKTNGKTLNINYDNTGNQTCDKIATVTYNGKTKDITLW